MIHHPLHVSHRFFFQNLSIKLLFQIISSPGQRFLSKETFVELESPPFLALQPLLALMEGYCRKVTDLATRAFIQLRNLSFAAISLHYDSLFHH